MGAKYSFGMSAQATTEATPEYQPWTSYPDTPVLTEDYPYQCIINYSGYWLVCCGIEICTEFAGSYYIKSVGVNILSLYTYSGSAWSFYGTVSSVRMGASSVDFIEANNDVYTSPLKSAVAFSKTTI
jgi:hypothetical protein